MASGLELGRFIEAGDLRRAGEWLVRNYAADVVSMCRAMVRERNLAEDLAQDAFSSAFTHLGSFRREASPRTWLLAITRNRCIDHLRRLERDPWGGAGDDEAEPDAHPDDAPLPAEIVLRRADVETALGSLAEAERALVVLRFRHGLEYPELANVFGLREGTVRMRLSRALAKMRDELEALDAAVDEVTPVRARQSLRAAPPPAAFGAPPPPPRAAPLPAPSRAPGAPPPRPAPGAPPPAYAAAPPPLAQSRAGWWTRLLAWFGARAAEPEPISPTPDDDVSGELRERLDALVQRLPSR